jgi:hypothetical protein
MPTMPARPDGLSIPFVVAIGNHEVIGGYGQIPEKAPLFFNLFPFPEENNPTYCVDLYEDLSVFVLNSNHTCPVEDQVDFLKQISFRKAGQEASLCPLSLSRLWDRQRVGWATT